MRPGPTPTQIVALFGALTVGCLTLNPAYDGESTGEGASGSGTSGGGLTTGVTTGSSTGDTSGVTGSGGSTGDPTTGGLTTTGAPTCDGANPCDPDAVCSVVGDAIECTCNEGYTGDGYTCVVVPALATLRWEMPCLPQLCGEACETELAETADAEVLTGEPGVLYDVTLRIRGVVEEKTYLGGTEDGHWHEGGEPADDAFNEMYLDISAPPRRYWLNGGTSNQGWCVPLDYQRGVEVEAGATVTIGMFDPNTCQILNQDQPGGDPIVIPDIPPAPNFYDGQFVQVDAVSFAPK